MLFGFQDNLYVQFRSPQYHQSPPIILLDCSKLQLGRGRLDDTVSSFRRRLELFRELTLPMIKEMDTAGRLTIVSVLTFGRLSSIIHVPEGSKVSLSAFKVLELDLASIACLRAGHIFKLNHNCFICR